MKPILMIAIVMGSLAAGAAGGIIATELAAPKALPTTQASTAEVAEGTDHSADLQRQDDSIAALNKRLGDMEVKLVQAEKKAADYAKLEEKYDANNKRIADLEKNRGSGTVDSGGTGGGTADPATSDFKAAVEAAIEEREAEKAKAEQERREKQMQEWADAQKKSIIDKLVTDLTLTTEQQNKVDVIITDYQTKQRDLWTRSAQAREKGEEFDWRAESAVVETAAQDAIRAELLGGQLETFNTLVSERGLNSLGGRGFGMGGQGGRTGGQGGGRRGN
ncbi:MAG: hypothetical protein IPK87_08365 [Planctomycetes bacterium]|nr:hypothetical protein [Planctomycetota bacterium]